ncbi:hypothetical protein GCM10020216_100020 [Nonomuraea helvata]
MICESCKEKRHEDCRGGSWCDCQHQTDARTEPDGAEAEAATEVETEMPEPTVNWLRQG